MQGGYMQGGLAVATAQVHIYAHIDKQFQTECTALRHGRIVNRVVALAIRFHFDVVVEQLFDNQIVAIQAGQMERRRVENRRRIHVGAEFDEQTNCVIGFTTCTCGKKWSVKLLRKIVFRISIQLRMS